MAKTIGGWSDHILGYTNTIILWMIGFGYNTLLISYHFFYKWILVVKHHNFANAPSVL
ncbi:hypothetical protein [Flavivirga spongiicola]|uniref:Uncharacterized protein n=1 Tax=Flavivirga spongiicola TaxID=421621 RepID=A0ABU7XXS8_9FLAO|nr:hypothetical protein [Flavivirga sp. MEBiC05379]MDO5980577.1 hypothetical protein [Flavivirga sp. MEBiC05379]